MGEFSSGLFACFSDPGTCLLACFGFPFLAEVFTKSWKSASNLELHETLKTFQVGKNAESVGENPALWALSSCSPCVTSLLRNKIRKTKKIEGRYLTDLLIHFCCFCCALSQEGVVGLIYLRILRMPIFTVIFCRIPYIGGKTLEISFEAYRQRRFEQV